MLCSNMCFHPEVRFVFLHFKTLLQLGFLIPDVQVVTRWFKTSPAFQWITTSLQNMNHCAVTDLILHFDFLNKYLRELFRNIQLLKKQRPGWLKIPSTQCGVSLTVGLTLRRRSWDQDPQVNRAPGCGRRRIRLRSGYVIGHRFHSRGLFNRDCV